MVEDLRSILENLGYTQITEYGKELRMAPIYRESNNRTALCVYKESGRWIDYAANIQGELDDLIKLSLSLSSIEEVKKWKENKNVFFVPKDNRSNISTQTLFNKNSLSNLIKNNEYWNKRCISNRVLDLFKGGVACKGKMEGRYVFPVFNSRNDLVGFSGRDVSGKSSIKWKILGEKESWVYPAFLNRESINITKQVVLVEGISDLLSLYEVGIVNVLSLFGVYIQTGLLNFLIRRDVRKIIISTNNDDDKIGNNAARLIKERLSAFFDEESIEVVLPQRKDFNEVLVNDGHLVLRNYFSKFNLNNETT